MDNIFQNLLQNYFLQKSIIRNSLMFTCGILLLGLILQKILSIIYEIKKLPPGPYGIPIFGYLAFVGNEKHTKYRELAKKYGSIFSARLGCQLNVVISDYKTIREAFKTYEFTNRPKTPLMDVINGFGKFNLFF